MKFKVLIFYDMQILKVIQKVVVLQNIVIEEADSEKKVPEILKLKRLQTVVEKQRQNRILSF